MKGFARASAEWVVAAAFVAVALGYVHLASVYYFALGVRVASLLGLLVAAAAIVLRLRDERRQTRAGDRRALSERWAAWSTGALVFAAVSCVVGIMVPSYDVFATACAHRNGQVVTGDEVTSDGPSPGYYCVNDRGRVLATFR